MKSLLEVIVNIDLISLFLGTVLGWFIKTGLDLYTRRPKLCINGVGGNKSQDGLATNHISIYNQLGWFGLRVGETRILGFKMHSRFSIGLPFSKTPAKDCRAQLFIANTDEHVCQLWWGTPNGPVEESKTIQSGENVDLILFVASENEGKYFPYQPVNEETGAIKLPKDSSCFSGSTDFYIRINHSSNQTFIYKLSISKKYDGKLYLESKSGSSLLLG